MNTIHLFSALSPQPGFPVISADMTIGSVRYDLVLPEEMSDLLLLYFINNPAYRQIGEYCNDEGISLIHKRPELLNGPRNNLLGYAVSFDAVEDAPNDDDFIGSFSMKLIVGPQAAFSLCENALTRNSIEPELADYVMMREAFFVNCHGFELLRKRYYFDAMDRESVMNDVERDEPPVAVLKEKGKRRVRLIDLL